MPKLKNIIIFGVIAVLVIGGYLYFKPAAESPNLLTNTGPGGLVTDSNSGTATMSSDAIGQDFLNLLLNVQNIKLDDSIFSDPAFLSLHDSSIVLVQDLKAGRPNPFAPLGTENTAQPGAGGTTTGGVSGGAKATAF